MNNKSRMTPTQGSAQKILSGKRISIPDEILKQWGAEVGSLVLVRKEGKGIYIAPAKLIEA